MNHRQRMILASMGIVGIFVLIQVGALALVEPFQQGGLQGVEDTENPGLSILYVGGILLATLFMLGAIKYGGEQILRLIIIFAGVYIAFIVFDVLLPPLGTVSGLSVSTVLAVAFAFGLGGVLYTYPEWYVIDAAGIVMGIGAAGLFGINFGVLPALVLLVVLAVYDAISVYGTEHMLTLASGVMDMRVPVVFVVPLSLSYSFLDDSKPETVENEGSDTDPIDEELPTDPAEIDAETLNDLGADGVTALDRELLAETELAETEIEKLDDDVREIVTDENRDAMFIGLGDAVIPAILVASVAFFVDAGPTLSILGVSANLPAVTAMIGTIVGLVVLLYLVQKGRAHAGLPLLNGGAIAGYLLGALASGLTLVEALGLETFL